RPPAARRASVRAARPSLRRAALGLPAELVARGADRHRRRVLPQGRDAEAIDRGPQRAGSRAGGLERDVPVLPGRALHRLAEAQLEAADERAPGLPRLDDVVDVAALRGDVRVREPGRVVGDELLAPRV